MPPGTLPPPGRDRGNSAGVRPPPAAARKRARHRSSRGSSRDAASGPEQAQRADLEAAAGFVGFQLARGGDGLLKTGAFDDIEAEKLLFGLGKGPVDDHRLSPGTQRG